MDLSLDVYIIFLVSGTRLGVSFAEAVGGCAPVEAGVLPRHTRQQQLLGLQLSPPIRQQAFPLKYHRLYHHEVLGVPTYFFMQ